VSDGASLNMCQSVKTTAHAQRESGWDKIVAWPHHTTGFARFCWKYKNIICVSYKRSNSLPSADDKLMPCNAVAGLVSFLFV